MWVEVTSGLREFIWVERLSYRIHFVRWTPKLIETLLQICWRSSSWKRIIKPACTTINKWLCCVKTGIPRTVKRYFTHSKKWYENRLSILSSISVTSNKNIQASLMTITIYHFFSTLDFNANLDRLCEETDGCSATSHRVRQASTRLHEPGAGRPDQPHQVGYGYISKSKVYWITRK